MSERIKIDGENDIILIDSSGDVTVEIIKSSIKEILKIMDKTGINKVLVDTRYQSSFPGVTEIFEIFSNFERSISVAHLYEENQKNINDLEFLENVCINRGYKVKNFIEKSDALDWLKSID